MVDRCATCGIVKGQGCPGCGAAPVPSRPIRQLGLWLSGLLVMAALVIGGWALAPAAQLSAMALMLICVVLTVVWLHRARANVEEFGGQRRHRAWVIWGWLCPVVNLWFPLQVMGDVARVDRQDAGAAGAALLRYGWWACWLLAWATGFHVSRAQQLVPGGAVEHTRVGFELGGSVLSRVFLAVAGVLLALVVHDISTQQEKRLRARSRSDPAVTAPR